MVWLLITVIIIIREATAQDGNQTYFTCNETQVLRQGKGGEDICCYSAKCKLGETFLLCSENDGQDICSSCGDEYYTALRVDTALVHIQFDPCMKLKCSDGAVNINGSCICDILNGYYGNDSTRCIPKNCTAGFVLTLNGDCKLCETQDDCAKLDRQIHKNRGGSYVGITVGITCGLAIVAMFIGIFMYRRRRITHRPKKADCNLTLNMDCTYYSIPGSSNIYKTGKEHTHMEDGYLDPLYNEPFEGSINTTKKTNCIGPCMYRGLKEKEEKQQAQPLNPRPVVVYPWDNPPEQESSLSSYPNSHTDDDVLLQDQSDSFELDDETYDVVGVPYVTTANNQPELDNKYTDDPDEPQYISACSACSVQGSICSSNYLYAPLGNRFQYKSPHQPYEGQLYEDATSDLYAPLDEIHYVTYPHDTVPKAEFRHEHGDQGEQPYFSHFKLHSMPMANSMTVNGNLSGEDKGCSEEDLEILYEAYNSNLDAPGNANDEYGSEVLSYNVHQRKLCATHYENVENKNQSNNELDSDVNFHNTETANDDWLQPEQLVQSREEKITANPISQEDKEQVNQNYSFLSDCRSLFTTYIDNPNEQCQIHIEHGAEVISIHPEIARSQDHPVLHVSAEYQSDGDVKCKSNDEPLSEIIGNKSEIDKTKEPGTCTVLIQNETDNDLPSKDQELHNHSSFQEDKCVRPKEFVKPRDEKKTASLINQEDKEPATCTVLIQKETDNDLPSTDQESHNHSSFQEDKCVRPKEFVQPRDEKKTASLINQEDKDQSVRPKEFVKTREKEKKTATAISQEDKEPSICTGLTQRHNDHYLPMKNKEPHKNKSSKENMDQCVRPKESVNTRDEKKTGCPKSKEQQVKEPPVCSGLTLRHNDNDLLLKIQEQHNLTASKLNKDKDVRPKEFEKQKEETNTLKRIVQEDKFSSPTLECHRDIASRMNNFVQNARILSEKNKDMEERIVFLQGENDQKDLTIKKIQEERDTKTSEVLILQKQLVQLQMALQEKTEKLDSIEQHLPELTDLLGQDTVTDISHQKDNQMRVYYDKQPTAAE